MPAHGHPSVHAVVFDLGKVLLDFDYLRAARALAPHCRLPAEAIRPLLDQSPLLHDFESGRIDATRFLDAVREAVGFTGTDSLLLDAFADIFTEIPDMIRLQDRLRAARIPTYIFSNTNPVAVAHIRQRHPFFNTFDGHVLSYEAGTMKPDPAIYRRVEELAGCDGSRILYLDDRIENIHTARVRGWQAIHHADPAASTTEVAARVPLP